MFGNYIAIKQKATLGMVGEELDEGEGFKKEKRRGWGGEELDEREGFELFTFWFGILDVEKQKKVEK